MNSEFKKIAQKYIKSQVALNEYEPGDFERLKQINTQLQRLRAQQQQIFQKIKAQTEELNYDWNMIVRRNRLTEDEIKQILIS